MLKKFALTAALVAIGLGVVHATGLSSYTSTAAAKIRGGFKRAVPLEFEIERLRHEVSQLIPEMKKNFTCIAEEMVAVENLDKEIKITASNLQKQKDMLLTMTKDLESGKTMLVYGGREYPPDRIKAKLARDWASYQACTAELKAKEQLLDAKQEALDATRERLSTIKTQKQELEVEVARLEAELKTVRLAQTRNKFHFDDSRLARCKATLAEIKNRLNVEKKANDIEGQFANDNIPVDKKVLPTSELIHEIKAHFGNSAKDDKSLAENK